MSYNEASPFLSVNIVCHPSKRAANCGEPVDDLVEAIAQATQEPVEQRDRWLAPSQPPPNTTMWMLNQYSKFASSYLPLRDTSRGEVPAGRRGLKRTLTNLYNARPTWLELAHKKLDKAVFAAYGWPRSV